MNIKVEEKQAARLKLLVENIIKMLAASHKDAGRHAVSDCSICGLMEMTNAALADAFDRRKSRRTVYLTGVKGFSEGIGRFATRISDLSRAGAFIDSIDVFPTGTRMKLDFTLGAKKISLEAEVRYGIEHIGMGVRFVNPSAADAAAISAFLKSR